MKIIATLLAAVSAIALAGCKVAADEPTAVQSAGSVKKGAASKSVPIKLVARRAKATKSVLSTGHPLSCVKVTVTNQTKKKLEVNPLYFSLTDTGGTKHDISDAMGEYEHEIGTMTLDPHEKATGMVCGEGKFTPKFVAMTNPLFSEAARAEVA